MTAWKNFQDIPPEPDEIILFRENGSDCFVGSYNQDSDLKVYICDCRAATDYSEDYYGELEWCEIPE